MSTASSSKGKEYSFSFDGVSSGASYRLYRKALLNEAAGTTDESGSSLADHYLDTDMGGAAAGAMAIPGRAAGQKFVRLQRSRAKKAFQLLIATQQNPDLVAILSESPYFQDGRASLLYLDTTFDTRVPSARS